MRIFLSSTYRDLQFERRLVREHLRKSHHIISAMETDWRTGFSWPRWSKNEAGKCDIYLRIYDRRTGTEDPEQIINLANNSITEIEYRFARPRALRCLSYQLIHPLRDIGSYITEREMDDYLLTVNEADKFTSLDYYVRQQVESAFRKGLALSSMADLFCAT